MKPSHRLEAWLLSQAAARGREALLPIRPTRELGEQFGVSHATAFRLLCRMEGEGKVWRHRNGRFYPALAGRVLGRPKPLAAMLRQMRAWSALCREVMEGFTEAVGERGRDVFLFHNPGLLSQEEADSVIAVAPPARQREMLGDLFLLHGEALGGILLDELWSDAVLAEAFPEPRNAVVFFRQSGVGTVGNVAADFKAGARLALGHLEERGCRTIFFIDPLPGYEPARQFLAAARREYRKRRGAPFPAEHEIPFHDAARRAAFLDRLAREPRPCGIFCPEDNVSLRLARALRERGMPHRLVTGMGTAAAVSEGLAATHYDFREIGRRAAAMLCDEKPGRIALPPVLLLGE